MEDDRVEQNEGEKVNGLKVGGAVLGAMFLMGLWLSYAPDQVNPSIPSAKPATTAAAESKPSPEPVEMAPAPVESKKEYIASTKQIGRNGSAIYYKEFLKSPDKFTDQRLNIRGQIMAIEESDNQTVIQLQITGKLDTVIAHYPGSVKVYEDDWVTIYGEGKGTFEGANRMGASMSWPIIAAKYVVKHASGD